MVARCQHATTAHKRTKPAHEAVADERGSVHNAYMGRGWVKAGAAAGLICCGAVAWFTVHYVVQARDQSTAGTVAQALAAVLVPMAGLAVWLVRQAQRSVPAIDLRQAADDLAGRVGQQWRDAALQRGLFDRPVAVRWTWSARGLSGPVRDAVGDQRAPRFVPLPGLARITSRQLGRGHLGDLFAVYGGLDSGRIVLAGAPGAGKSGAMIRLLLDAVTHREGIRDPAVRATVPVPVLLTAYDWVPSHEGLTAWVTRRLEDEHPFLKSVLLEGRAGPVSAARALMDTGAVSVLLDGVDEMPPESRTAVLREIGQQAGYRVVLSCRVGELAGAVSGGHLDGAAALELTAITARQAADYLQSRTVHPAPAPWQALIQHLREHETSPVAQALDSPLMLSLLLDTYLPFDPVDELTEPGRFPGREQIEDHLLARILPAAYAPRPGSPAPPCTPGQAQHWLGYVAAQMNRFDTRDLAWWRIPRWLPSRRLMRTVGAGAALAKAITAGLSYGLAIGVTSGGTAGLIAGLTVGLIAGTLYGIAARLTGGIKIGLTIGLATASVFGIEVGLAIGIMSGLRLGLKFGVTAGLGMGLTVALTIGLTVGIAAWLTTGLTTGLDTTAYDGFPPQYRRLREFRRLTVETVTGLIVGSATGAVAGLIYGLIRPLTSGLTVGLGVALLGSLATGATAGLAAGLVSGLTQAFSASMPADKLSTPVGSWHGNRRLVRTLEAAAGMTVAIVAGAAAGVLMERITGVTADGAAAGLAVGATVGLSAVFVVGATNVNFFMPAYAAFALLRHSGHGPARMMDFLEDARERGVLRTAGPVYQFRHARLQDLLATAPPLSEPSPASPPAAEPGDPGRIA